MKKLIIILIIGMINMASSDIDIARYDRLLKDVMDRDSSNRSTRTTEIIYSGAGELPLKCISTLSKTCWLSEYEGSGGLSDMYSRCACRCNTGFHQVSNNCIKIRVFGGGLVYDNPYQDSYQDINQTTKDYLNGIYGSDDKFQGIKIISPSGETMDRSTEDQMTFVVVYELLFDASSHKTEDDIVNILNSHCSSNSTTFGNLTLNCNESISYVYDQITKCGTIYSDYCDHHSTSCHVNDGEAYCQCRENFHNSNKHFTSCTEQICLSDADCSAPFGKCLLNYSKSSACTCFWGFNGSRCENFTIFVLTAVIGLILLLIIIILLCRCCRQGNQKKKARQKESSSDVLGTLADLSEVQFDYQPGQMRARLPSQKPRAFPRSATSTFSGPSVNTSSGRVESSGVSLHHYTNQSFVGVDHVKHARAQLNKDLKRADYF